MTRQQFLQEFLYALEPLSPEERQQISDYYEELICDGLEQGLTEEEVLARFGSPQEEAARFRAENPSSPPPQEPSLYTPRGEIHTLDLSSQCAAVSLIPVESGPISISFAVNPQRDLVETSEEGGVWTFRHTLRRKRLRHFFGFGLSNLKIQVRVPHSFHGTLLIATSNATVTGEGLPALERLTIHSTNDTIRLNTVEASTCNLETSNASIRVQNYSGQTLHAKSSNGTLEGEIIRCYGHHWETSNAAIRLTDAQSLSLTAATSNGRITACACESRELHLVSSNASLILDNIAGDQLTLCTSNGAITGTVRGNPQEYRIEGHTSNASCNLPSDSRPLQNTEANKLLSACTSNGKIHVDFV